MSTTQPNVLYRKLTDTRKRGKSDLSKKEVVREARSSRKQAIHEMRSQLYHVAWLLDIVHTQLLLPRNAF